VLEWRYPVVLETFHIRHSSGGAGEHRGGNGVVRRVRFGEAMQGNVLSSRRGERPDGVAGGSPGAVGHHRHIRRAGSAVELPGNARVDVETGDRFEIETPGGGGYGQPA
jgi:5-oxoprolinase (ATP-hydrolysing)